MTGVAEARIGTISDRPPSRVRPVVLSLSIHTGLLVGLAVGVSTRPPVPPSPVVIELRLLTTIPVSAAVMPPEVSPALPDPVEPSQPPLAETMPPASVPVPDAIPAMIPPAPLVVAANDLAPAPLLRPITPPQPTNRPAVPRRVTSATTPVRSQIDAGVAAASAPSTSASSASVVSPSGPSVPGPMTPAAISSSWRSAVAAWIATHKRYPEQARVQGLGGAVGVMFRVERDGRVERVVIERASGVPSLDRSVNDMLEDHVVPAFTADMPQTRADVRVTIRFTIEN